MSGSCLSDVPEPRQSVMIDSPSQRLTARSAPDKRFIMTDDDIMAWYDYRHQTRPEADPGTEALIHKCDALPHETRLAVLKALHQECGVNGDNFDAAIRAFGPYIEAAEPSEDSRADAPENNAPENNAPENNAGRSSGGNPATAPAATPAGGAGGGVFMPDAFPPMRGGSTRGGHSETS